MMPCDFRDRHEYVPYVRHLADMLALRDWAVPIEESPPDAPDAFATIECIEGRKRANLRLSETFLRDDDDEQRHTVVHELIHCHFATLSHAADKMIDTNQDVFGMLIEQAVDALADAIAPLVPTPDDILEA